jgi:hypothetical protein
MPTATTNSPQTDSAPSDLLQEYADNRGATLRVDRVAGVIPGVKLLGFVSRKGREYPKAVMAKALPLYEGMPVNVDHVDPGQRRSLRDRIGLVKNVMLKEDGLYGDFHFNPKHPLAEQIAWDAENAPQNLGFSHDTRGASRNRGGRIVVESIDQVLSVDLVANPATTNGLFEDEFHGAGAPGGAPSTLGRGRADYAYTPGDNESDWKLPIHDARHVAMAAAALSSGGFRGQRADIPASALAGVKAKIRAAWKKHNPDKQEKDMPDSIKESIEMDWNNIDLDGIKNNRPDLLTAFQESLEKGDELKALQEELKTLKAEKAARQLQEAIAGELKAAGLDPANKTQCSEVFLEDLSATADPARRKAKIDDRKALVSAARPAAAPSTVSPLQESHDAGRPIPPATAPLAQRIARFTK